MTILADTKTALRITNTAYDGEITDLISAAKAHLLTAGISVTASADDTDALIKRAIITYCKAEFGLDNPDSEKYMKAYMSLESHLALSGDYREASL